MDPLSITTGCIGLISAIGTLSLSINSFVRTYREARSDLDRVARELLSLQTVLELIKDAIDEDRSFPDTLAYHVSGILANCHSVVLELQGCITKYCNNRLRTRASWAISGQGDVAKLRSNLEAHKAALELALDMLALHTAKAIKMDTTEIRNDTSAIKDGTAQILKEINQLQARLSNQDDYILQKFLEDMTTYTENALDGASIDWKSSSTRVPSPIIEDEDVIGSAYLSGSELAHFNVHSNHSEYRVAEEGRLSVWECITNVETYYTGIEGEWRDICLRRRRRAAVMTEQHPPSPSTVPSEFFDAFILSFHWSGPQELDPFADVESFTTHFTASTIPGREFASQDTLRPSRFKPSRQIKIAFYIQVHTWMWLDDFETQLNFISTSLTALAQRVASSWQNIVIIIEGPPRWMGVDPEILMLFMALGILFESNQSIDYIGRVSVDPPYHMERDEIFERSILGTIYENTVNPSHGANCFKNVLITKSLQVIAVAPHQHQNDPAHYDLQHHNNWAAAVCKVLKPEFIVHIPEGEMAKIPHPDRFLADLWWCRTRFSNSMQDHVNQCVLLTPLEFQTGRVGVRPVRDRIAFLREPLPHPKQLTKPAESVRPRPESTPRNVSVQHRNYVYVLSGLIMLYISFILMCHWA